MTNTAYKPGPDDRRTLMEGPIGAILLLESEASDGHFSLLEHPLAPRALGAPVHTHAREDEYSLVVEGTIGVEIDGDAFEAGPGEIVVKPRGISHAFWNPTDQPARILELIVPGGFETYFAELGEILTRPGPPDLAAFGQLAARYELVMEPDSIGRLAAEHGLVMPA
jgi:mannose-6-phosphate isomerase-like protein (cupin superfamily)